jgi:hypothetical protein
MQKLDAQLRADLDSIFQSMMWLRCQPLVTDSRARAWYSHVMAKSVTRRIRRFSGKVSRAAVRDTIDQLVLEHFERMQTTLTALVAKHHKKKKPTPNEFISLVQKLEHVHIVTRSENYSARRAKGNYRAAGITLVRWKDIPSKRRKQLWKRMLVGRVCNAETYSPD